MATPKTKVTIQKPKLFKKNVYLYKYYQDMDRINKKPTRPSILQPRQASSHQPLREKAKQALSKVHI